MQNREDIKRLRVILSQHDFNRIVLPLVVCDEELSIVDKTPSADDVTDGLRKSSCIGRFIDEQALTQMRKEDIKPVAFLKPYDQRVFAIAFRTSLDNINCFIIALPLLEVPYDEGYEDLVKLTVKHLKTLINGCLSALLGEITHVRFRRVNDVIHDARRLCDRSKLECEDSPIPAQPTSIKEPFDLFLSSFNGAMNPYKVNVIANLPESINQVRITLNMDGFFSLLSVFLLTLQIISDNNEITIDADVGTNSAELIFSTKHLFHSEGEETSPLLPDSDGLPLDSLSTELMRVGHPLAVDILLLSAFLDGSDIAAAFNQNSGCSVLHLTFPIITSVGMNITVSSEHSTDAQDTPEIVTDITETVAGIYDASEDASKSADDSGTQANAPETGETSDLPADNQKTADDSEPPASAPETSGSLADQSTRRTPTPKSSRTTTDDSSKLSSPLDTE